MRQTILTLILLVLIAGLGVTWFRYFRPPSGATTPRPVSPEPGVAERLAAYRQLQTFTPDLSVFSDPRFRSLKRPGPETPPPAAPPGRSNPFAPF